eukprot:2816616-Lingulodinium_polyedra.AAC.1
MLVTGAPPPSGPCAAPRVGTTVKTMTRRGIGFVCLVESSEYTDPLVAGYSLLPLSRDKAWGAGAGVCA